jgi:F0F1-type ATP synthase assembly protein I
MPERDEEGVTRKSGIVYAAVVSFFISTVSFLLIGWALDRWLSTGPWLVVAGIVLGAGIGFYEFIRVISKLS